MDIPRPELKRKKRMRQAGFAVESSERVYAPS